MQPAALASRLISDPTLPDGQASDFQTLMDALGTSAQEVADWIGRNPALVLRLARAVSDDPTLLPNAVSTLIHNLVELVPDRSGGGGGDTTRALQIERSLLGSALIPIVQALGQILPPPLGNVSPKEPGVVVSLAKLLSDVINEALATLPPQLDQVNKFADLTMRRVSPLDQFAEDFQTVLDGIGTSQANVFSYIGAAPTQLGELVQAVIAHPTTLPNALSSIAYSLFALPDFGGSAGPYLLRLAPLSLLGGAVSPIINALAEVLPAPLGTSEDDPGVLLKLAQVYADVVNGQLSLLPPPLERLRQPAPAVSVFAMQPVSSPIDNLTDSIQIIVSALGNSAEGVLNVIGAMPGGYTRLISAVLDDPRVLPNVLSSIVYGLVSLPGAVKFAKADFSRIPGSLLSAALQPIVEALDQVLPAPLGSTDSERGVVVRGWDAFSKTVNDALKLLPDPYRPKDELNQLSARQVTPVDQFNEDFQTVFSALGASVSNTADGVGGLPGTLAKLTEAVAKDPRLLPRAVSTLVNDAFGIADAAQRPIVRALDQVLPPPLGTVDDEPGLIQSNYRAAQAKIERTLSRLPRPLPIGSNQQEYSKLAGSGAVISTAAADPGQLTKKKVQRPRLISLNVAGQAGNVAKHRPGIGKSNFAEHFAKKVAEHRAERRAAHAEAAAG